MSSVDVDGYTFSLSGTSERIYVFKGDALVTYQDYPSHEDALEAFEKVRTYKKVVFASNDNNGISGERGPGVGDGSDPKNCSNLPIERRQPSPKTSHGNKATVEGQ